MSNEAMGELRTGLGIGLAGTGIVSNGPDVSKSCKQACASELGWTMIIILRIINIRLNNSKNINYN